MWKAIAASIRGSSHEDSGAPCQDASGFSVIHDPQGNRLVIAVADGAGSSARSDEGAKTAVHAAMEAISKRSSLGHLSCVVSGESAVREAVAEARQALEDLANSPADLGDFACTLLVVVAGPAWWASAHIGDGGVVVELAEGMQVASWPQQGRYANETNFLTGEHWEGHVRANSESAAPTSVVVFTDGLQHLVLDYQTRQPEPRFVRPLARAVRDSTDSAVLHEQLSEFLRSERIRERTDDDVTLVVAVVEVVGATE